MARSLISGTPGFGEADPRVAPPWPPAPRLPASRFDSFLGLPPTVSSLAAPLSGDVALIEEGPVLFLFSRQGSRIRQGPIGCNRKVTSLV